MIYPHPVRENSSLQSAPDAAQNLYAVSCSVYYEGHTETIAGWKKAVDSEHAHLLVMAEFKKSYPECRGYLRHQVDVAEIPDELLASLGYHR